MSNKRGQFPGAYVLKHIESGKEYIGSTGNLNIRQVEHRSKLNTSSHHIKQLQELYDKDNKIDFIIFPTETRDEAYSKEQILLNSTNKELLLNKSLNSRSSEGLKPSVETREKMSKARANYEITEETRRKISNANSGRVFTDEHKQNIKKAQILLAQTKEGKERLLKNSMKTAIPININGKDYTSVREASRSEGISKTTLLKIIKR